eukprot:11491483-Ditylum_brightwellii.AAC.1
MHSFFSSVCNEDTVVLPNIGGILDKLRSHHLHTLALPTTLLQLANGNTGGNPSGGGVSSSSGTGSGNSRSLPSGKTHKLPQ